MRTTVPPWKRWWMALVRATVRPRVNPTLDAPDPETPSPGPICGTPTLLWGWHVSDLVTDRELRLAGEDLCGFAETLSLLKLMSPEQCARAIVNTQAHILKVKALLDAIRDGKLLLASGELSGPVDPGPSDMEYFEAQRRRSQGDP